LAGTDSNTPGPSAIHIRGLTVSFGLTNVLRNLDLQLASGETRVILGPNGAGKSTFFNALSGLVKAQSGLIELASIAVVGRNPHLIARQFITRSFQVPQLSPSLTVLEHLCLSLGSPLGSVLRRPRISGEVRASAFDVLMSFHLRHLADSLPSAMTHAERKLLDIAIAMSRELPILLLDEPGAGLGLAEKDLLRSKVLGHPGRTTTLIIEHDIESIGPLGLPVLFMHEGRFLFDGSLSEVEQRAKKAGVYF
jgi:ABC-type branched-subunit amino acid transport system ATPase component